MRKKRLSDVLRQETQQPSNPESTDAGAGSGDNPPLVPLKLPQPESTAPPSSPPPIDLSAAVAELKKSLQAAQASEQKLQKQLKEAQSKLKEQTDLNQTFTADRAKIEALTKELAEAKATILQLVAAKQEQPKSAIQSSLRRYPVQSNDAVKQRSKTDIGWMD